MHACAAEQRAAVWRAQGSARARILRFEGGIDVPRVLGSRATHIVSALGGIDGRALKAGDRLQLGEPMSQVRRPSRLAPLAIAGGARPGHARPAGRVASTNRRLTSCSALASPSRQNRIEWVTACGSRIPDPSPGPQPRRHDLRRRRSWAACRVPPSGEPILLMADRQTTGGYPQIATVITADLPLAGQLAPGDWIEFALCTRSEALAALKEQDEALRAV